MITQYRLKVKAEDGQKLHFHWGYTLYGILAQYANTEYIEKIHQQKYTPVSQYLEVLPTGTEAYWYINLFGEQATKEIGMVLEQHHSFHAEHHHTVLQVIDAPEEKQVSELDFCRKYLVEQPTKRQIKVQCITPMGFKSQGNYQIFPTEALFLQSMSDLW